MIRNLVVAVAFAMALTVKAQVAPGTPVPLGGYLQDSAGNLYQVVLQPVPKVATAPAAPAAAPVVAAPAPVVVQQPAQQVVYTQAPAQQSSGIGRYVGDVLVTGAGGGAQGAIVGAITGRNVAKEALGTAAGTAGGKVTGDLINGIFKR